MLMYFFGILGIHLFKMNDVLHFGSFHGVFITLLRCATEGNWPHLMYTNMYGCWDYYEKVSHSPNAVVLHPGSWLCGRAIDVACRTSMACAHFCDNSARKLLCD
jgi:hypothetical protein